MYARLSKMQILDFESYEMCVHNRETKLRSLMNVAM